MITTSESGNDVILITGEPYDDHPLSPAGVIVRVLDAKGYKVGIIENPSTEGDFTALGEPRLFFGVTSGSVDSMVNNYTPLKRKREDAPPMPDRAAIVYCNGIRRHFEGARIVIGGVEASLRRFAHYDYWDNKLRRSILLDSRADVLVYGNGELQAIEIARRLDDGGGMDAIEGTCVLRKELPGSFTLLPSFSEVKEDTRRFAVMQSMLSNGRDLAQEYDNNYVLQYSYPDYTPADLDWIYGLGYSRNLGPRSRLGMARFSVVTHRGCVGNCRFCSIALHQGDKVVSRSEEGIIREIEALTRHPDFKGYIDDLGGPSANMYGMDCDAKCGDQCLECERLDKSHGRLLGLMRRAREVPGVRRVFVRSGVRYDLAVESEEYVRELSGHHVSGTLKIAPEHFSGRVLELMGKDNARFDEFVRLFESINEGTGQALRYYLMICHPGDDMGELDALLARAGELENIEQFQLFTPTPMTASTCMYWTGLDPFTMDEVQVVRDYATKKRMKRKVLGAISSSRSGGAGD